MVFVGLYKTSFFLFEKIIQSFTFARTTIHIDRIGNTTYRSFPRSVSCLSGIYTQEEVVGGLSYILVSKYIFTASSLYWKINDRVYIYFQLFNRLIY